MTEDVVIDCAGAFIGGAARFLTELDHWRIGQSSPPTIIGRGRRLSASWIASREVRVRPSKRRIALNNVSFVRSGGARTVLLRNALHFASENEMADLDFTPGRSFAAQIQVVRRAAARADRVIVPCSSMAERVVKYIPSIQNRLSVSFHPVSDRPWAGAPPLSKSLLVPVVNSPYKQLNRHLRRLLDVLDETKVEEVRITSRPSEFSSDIVTDRRVKFLGVLTSEELDRHFAECSAIYFPTRLESFGYPLAEARANGRRVVALATEQNREIAGPALAGYRLGDDESLRSALEDAMAQPIPPDPNPFDPSTYFANLVNPRSRD